MTSASRPIDSPLLSATGRFSSRDRRKVALFSGSALGPAAGVVVMTASSYSDANVFPIRPGVMSSAATLTQLDERAVYVVVLSRQAATTPGPLDAGRRVSATLAVMVRSLW